MSVKRRLAAAGLPVAGVTVFAALALTGQPATAAIDAVAAPQAITATCDAGPRTSCGYGSSDDTDPAVNNDDDSDDTAPGSRDGDDEDNGPGVGAGAGMVDDDDRGGYGYGGESPTPSASINSVPPGGAGPATTPPGGAGPDDILPVTGAPMAALTTIGGLLTAAGAALCFGIWYNARRRRRA